MKKHVTNSLLILALVSSVGCGKKLVGDSDGGVLASATPEEASAEAAVQAIESIADEQDGASYAVRSEHMNKYERIASLFFPTAKAGADCRRAVTASCMSGVKSMQYSTCDLPFTSYTLDGDVALNYSTSTCSMAVAGESVSASRDVTFTGPRGALLRNFSSHRSSAVDGSVIGGGSRLARTSTGWEVEVPGKHVVAQLPSGRTLFDVSVRTTAPIVITGTLSRANRLVNGGSVEVHHNIAGIKATYTPINVQYVNTCCHPVSGSWAVAYSGKKTGSATLTFNGCGDATLTDGAGAETPVQLSYCQ
ncbi:MAG: hypothetical protein AAB250_00400 [Bdellovibrionota bacterium]